MSRPLRVLLVSQPTSGGAGRCIQGLAEAGVEAGFEMQVACPAEGPLAGGVVGVGARWIPLELERAPRPGDVRHVGAIRRAAAGMDVVHLHSSKAGAVGRVAIRSLGRRRPATAFTAHGWSWQADVGGGTVFREVERLLAGWTDVVIAVSGGDRRAGAAVLPSGTRLETIENGVDPARYSPDGPGAGRRPEPLIVSVGRITDRKGQGLAVQALALLEHPGAVLRLVGDGPGRATVAAIAADLGVSDRVEMVGEVHDVAPHLRDADVVLVPSYSEGMSLAMLEAMSCANLVISTAVAGSEVLDGAGVVVPIGDAAALAAALDTAIARPEWAADRGRAARELIQECYTLRRSTDRHLALWRSLASGRSGTVLTGSS